MNRQDTPAQRTPTPSHRSISRRRAAGELSSALRTGRNSRPSCRSLNLAVSGVSAERTELEAPSQKQPGPLTTPSSSMPPPTLSLSLTADPPRPSLFNRASSTRLPRWTYTDYTFPYYGHVCILRLIILARRPRPPFAIRRHSRLFPFLRHFLAVDRTASIRRRHTRDAAAGFLPLFQPPLSGARSRQRPTT